MGPVHILLLLISPAILAQNPQQPEKRYCESSLAANTAADPRYNARISDFIAKNVLQFARGIGAHLEKQKPNEKSQIFSPVSLSSALALILMGANEATYRELNTLFHIDEDSELLSRPYKVHEEYGLMLDDLSGNCVNPGRRRPQSQWKFTGVDSDDRDVRSQQPNRVKTPNEHKVRVANGIFVQQGFGLRKAYRQAARSIYKARVHTLDFHHDSYAAKAYINDWANNRTFGKIPNIIADDIAPETNVILASSVYFKGFWETAFLAGGTHEGKFYVDGKGGPEIKVKMMANGGVFPYYDAPEYDCRIIGFPYKRNLTTMYVIQPNDSTRQKLRALQSALTAEKIESMISKMTRKTAVLVFPKMHISNTLDLKKILVEMGVKSLFQSATSDLSLLAAGEKSGDVNDLFVEEEYLSSDLDDQEELVAAPASTPRPFPTLPPLSNARPEPSVSSKWEPSSPVATQQNNAAIPVLQPIPREPLPSVYHPVPDMANTFYNTQHGLIFTRFGEDNSTTSSTTSTTPTDNSTESLQRPKRAVTYKVESKFQRSNPAPLRLKDLIIKKRTTKFNPGKKLVRSRRETTAQDPSEHLKRLDALRQTQKLPNPHLFVDDIIHKIDLTINEQGTEAAAATVSYLRRSGTDVVFRADTPFLILIRHDTTKLPLFYGTVYEPTE